MLVWRVTLFALAFSLAISASAAQSGTVLPARKLAKGPVIDGKVDPAEWAEASIGEGFVYSNNGQPIQSKTRFRLAYDEKYIYFAGEVQCDSKRLSADETRANVDLEGNDTFGFWIDPFGTLQDYNSFLFNPRGASEIHIAGGRAAKTEWVGEVLTAGRVTATGWEIEARIPWGIIELPSKGTHDMRFNVNWYNSATQQSFNWIYTGEGTKHVGYFKDVDVPATDTKRSLLLLPYLYAGLENDNQRITNAGLDFKTEIKPGLMAVGTVSPDFRGIENQVLSVDFNYLARLAGESRPFFQEGREYIQTGYDQRLFASQIIGDFDFGMNVYGQLGPRTRFGALTTANFGEEQRIAAAATNKIDDTWTANVAYVGLHKRGETNNAVQLNTEKMFGPYDFWLGTQITSDEVEGTGARTNFGFMKQAANIFLMAEVLNISERFYPRAGFSPERDMRGWNLMCNWQQNHPRGPIMETAIEATAVDYAHCTGGAYRSFYMISTSTTWRNGLDLDLSAFSEKFEGNDDTVYTFSIERPRNHPTRHWGFDVSFGTREGEPYRSATLMTKYRPTQKLQLDFRVQSVDHIDNREQVVAGFNYELGRNEAIGGRIVRSDKDWNGYLAYRKSGGKGSELFIMLGDPNAETFQRTFMLKMNWPLEVKY